MSHVTQVADLFHLIRLANSKLDECRRRVQNETMGHRGRKTHPLYRARRLLTKAHERLDKPGNQKLVGNLIKRIERIGFGFRRFHNYRIRALLYAGKPNWDLLATVTPR